MKIDDIVTAGAFDNILMIVGAAAALTGRSGTVEANVGSLIGIALFY